jgi:hypothetical protein
MRFNQPLPIPANALALTPDEQARLGKYLAAAEAAKAEYERTMAVVNDIGMTIAARAGRTETNFKLSADLGCLIPIEE